MNPVGDLHLCKPGYESVLTRELLDRRSESLKSGPGWVLVAPTAESRHAEDTLPPLCFAVLTLQEVQESVAPSVKQLAALLSDLFVASLGDRRVDEPWPLLFSSAEQPGLAARRGLVETRFTELARRRRARVLRLAQTTPPSRSDVTWGFFVHMIAADRALVATSASGGGPRRMRHDPGAPSRSYLKIEEALSIFGRSPATDERVVDLGAAPGGWSYAAAEHGAEVIAIDNGPLKGGAAGHARISHERTNAFTYEPRLPPVDWLLCDMLEDPDEVLALVRRWLTRGWCRHCVVNLKFGRTDPLRILRLVRDPRRGIAELADPLVVRQLFHDRDELTLMASSLTCPSEG